MTSFDEVAAELRAPGLRVAIGTHRNPDGDAIGSVLGLARSLSRHGADVVLWHTDGDCVPDDLRFLLEPDEAFSSELPADVGERLLIALDCASEMRLDPNNARTAFASVLNIDHHHDNTAFAATNLLAPDASSTAEIVARLIALAGLPMSADIAAPLYVGIVTDTGRFSYSNATPATHQIVATLLATGVDVAALSSRLYEDRPVEAVRLEGHAIGSLTLSPDGGFARAVLRTADMAEAGTDDAEGIVEVLRGMRGVSVAALLRPADEAESVWRVSLRSRGNQVDVSAVAREHGGGGHAAAAGCTVAGSLDDVLAWLDGAIERAR